MTSPAPTDEDALYDVIFDVLESRLEDVIDLDLNVPADSAVFRILVGQVRDAVEGFRRSAVSAPPTITDEAVERAARKMWEIDDAESDVSWLSNRVYYLDAARMVLAAALGGEPTHQSTEREQSNG